MGKKATVYTFMTANCYRFGKGPYASIGEPRNDWEDPILREVKHTVELPEGYEIAQDQTLMEHIYHGPAWQALLSDRTMKPIIMDPMSGDITRLTIIESVDIR